MWCQSLARLTDCAEDEKKWTSFPGHPIVQAFRDKPEKMAQTAGSVSNIETNKLQRPSKHERLSVPSLLQQPEANVAMGMEWTVRGLVLLHLIWNFDGRGRLLAGFSEPRPKACSNIMSNGEFRLMLLPIPAKWSTGYTNTKTTVAR